MKLLIFEAFPATACQPTAVQLVALAVVCFLLSVGTAVGGSAASSNPRRERMTFDLSNVTITEALLKASYLWGYDITISGRVPEDRLNLRFVDASLEDVLRKVLNGPR